MSRSITTVTQYVCTRLRSNYSTKRRRRRTKIRLLTGPHKNLQPNFLYLQTHERVRTLDQSKANQERIYSSECCVLGRIYIGGEGVKL